MKKRFFLSLYFMLAALLLCADSAQAARKNPIAGIIESDAVIKAYVSDIENSSGNNKIDLADLKNLIKEALNTRPHKKFAFSARKASHAAKFVIADKPADADIVIDTRIVEYLWTDNDPIDMIAGVYGIAYDAITRENYARMEAIFSIKNAQTGALLWEDTIRATITDKTMTEEKSYKRVNERIAKIFIRELFDTAEEKK